MNRHKVIHDDLSFKEGKKEIKNTQPPKDNGEMSLNEIIKFSNDKKQTRSNRKRKELTKVFFIEYMINTHDAD